MKIYSRHLSLLPILLLTAGAALAGGEAGAANATSVNGTMSMFQDAAMSIHKQLIKPALATAITALTLQWILTYWKELFSGELSGVVSKAVGLITWWGASVWLINHGDVMISVFNGYLKLSGELSALDSNAFSPGIMIKAAKDIIIAVNLAAAKAAGNNAFALGDNFLAAAQLTFVQIFVIFAYVAIALNLVTAILEFWMMMSVAPLAFGLIPLSALRDQGVAPIKGLISIGLRILILGVVVAVSQRLTAAIIAELNVNGLKNNGLLSGSMVDYIGAMAGCTMMAMYAGKIASSIASGSASFSGADAVKAGVGLTAGAGAAAAAGAAALTSAPAKALGNALTSGAGKALEGLRGMGSSGVRPALGSAGSGSAGGSGSSGLGGSPIQQRPFAADAAHSGGSSLAGAPSTPSGDGSSAGIGGSGPEGGSDGQKTDDRTRIQKLADSAGQRTDKALEANTQDQHSVGISLNLRGE